MSFIFEDNNEETESLSTDSESSQNVLLRSGKRSLEKEEKKDENLIFGIKSTLLGREKSEKERVERERVNRMRRSQDSSDDSSDDRSQGLERVASESMYHFI